MLSVAQVYMLKSRAARRYIPVSFFMQEMKNCMRLTFTYDVMLQTDTSFSLATIDSTTVRISLKKQRIFRTVGFIWFVATEDEYLFKIQVCCARLLDTNFNTLYFVYEYEFMYKLYMYVCIYVCRPVCIMYVFMYYVCL
jgi:hypothetical protein